MPAAPSSYTVLSRPAPVRPGDNRFVPLAAELGAQFAELAAVHDRENSFVAENFRVLRESGYTSLGVPEMLGGGGASLRQVCYAQAELARSCGSTALAVNMHLYHSLMAAYRWRHGADAAEGLLRRIAAERLIVMSSGGSDGPWPAAVATRQPNGYRVNGRKVFCSQAPAADLLSTFAAYDDPDDGRVVLVMLIPPTSDGYGIVETWDALGMRGTASHDVQLDDVLVGEDQIVARQPWGRVGVALRSALIHSGPTLSAVYYGIAAGAYEHAVRVLAGRRMGGAPASQDPAVARIVGRMEYRLRTAWWALVGHLNDLPDDVQYALDDQATSAAMLAKRCVTTQAVEVVDLAMEAVGGSAYFKRSPLERAYRDVRAGTFHPLPPEKTLQFAGRLALGQPVDHIW
jgi:acyl-CoA dehydrogenase